MQPLTNVLISQENTCLGGQRDSNTGTFVSNL